jgi:phosphinothricin acetyltransferase
MTDTKVRLATLADLAQITEIQNHYILNTHITFDVKPFTVEQRSVWFHDHNDGRRYRLFVAESAGSGILGYAGSGRFRTKEAYETTVEASIACHPQAVGRGLGTLLYSALFDALDGEDVRRIVAGIAQPNDASNALHEKMGFRRVGVFSRVGRKFGKYWDVLWMEREI